MHQWRTADLCQPHRETVRVRRTIGAGPAIVGADDPVRPRLYR